MSDLLRPRFTAEELAVRERLRSRLNVAATILDARVKCGLTQEQLGEAAGTKQSRVSELESLKGNPRFDTLDRISKALGLMVSLVPRSANLSPVPGTTED